MLFDQGGGTFAGSAALVIFARLFYSVARAGRSALMRLLMGAVASGIFEPEHQVFHHFCNFVGSGTVVAITSFCWNEIVSSQSEILQEKGRQGVFL